MTFLQILFLALGIALLALPLGLTALGFLVFLGLRWRARRARRLRRGTLIEWDLSIGISEKEQPARLGIRRGVLPLRQAVRAIDAAAGDPRVAALWADLSFVSLGMAQVQELHAAVLRFRAAGKPCVAFADSFGEEGGTAALLLASAFGRVEMQPSGTVSAGFSMEKPYFARLFAKLGLKAEVGQRKEFKSAMERFTRDSMSPSAREAAQAVLDDWVGQWSRTFAAGRGLKEEEVRALLVKAPLLPAEALQARWVDALGYRDESRARWEPAPPPPGHKTSKASPVVSLARYLARAEPRLSRRGSYPACFDARPPTGTCAASCSAWTARADPTPPPTRSRARCGARAMRARKSLSRWAI
ncbi:MAG: S49 family peptidase [Bdellovibrionales bacterium]|nr:S49 family peptidase [Bdellovibrionales bacterium]